jgi:3-dehydroquinate synthase II
MVRPAPLAWINLSHLKDKERCKEIATAALEQGFSHLVVTKEQQAETESLGRCRTLTLHDGGNHTRHVQADGETIAHWITLHDAKDEANAAALGGKTDHVVISATDWKIIPLENLIADLQPTRTHLLAEVTDAKEAAVMLNTLEVGTDGVLLSPKESDDVRDLARLLEEMNDTPTELVEAEIVRVEDAGRGERVCIDTCSLLAPGEGMLVGGSSKGLFLLHSESLQSPYVNARPFRVNAGAVYAYVLGTAGRTHYLSEVHAGLPVLAVDHKGNTRSVTVGRAKVETRPLLLVEARPTDSDDTYSVVVQNAETIRFVTTDGGALSVVDAKPGDRVLLHLSSAARHFGRPIKERIVET